MRLSEFPYVVVRVGCSRCARAGQYRLARLADRYGAEIGMPMLLGHLAGDCEHRDAIRRTHDYCGAYFIDIASPRPPDTPAHATGRPRIRLVG